LLGDSRTVLISSFFMFSKEKIAGSAINGLSYVAPSFVGRLMLDLFCRPQKGRVFTKKEQAFIDKAEWETLQLDGQKIQCYKWGNGSKKILLAHGFNSNAARWRPLVGLLSKEDYQIIALDIPAHGNSGWKRINGLLYARVVNVLMDHYQPQYVVGHSFAGIAFSYYFSKMENLPVQKIVLMGIPNQLQDIADVFFDTIGSNQRVRAAYFKAFKQKFEYDVDYFTLSNLLPTVPYPSLIIHDEEDDIASYDGAITIHKSWKTSTFFGTKGLGHSLQGRSVYREILGFIN